MTIYCPTCSRSSDDARFIGEFCEFCTADRLRARIPDRIEIQRCKRCGKIKVKGHFVPFAPGALSEQLTSALHVPGCTAKANVFFGNTASVQLTCAVGGDSLAFDKRIRIVTRHEMCPTDYKISSGYYEALVQIRGEPGKCWRMAERISRFLVRKGAFITRMADVRYGIDIYASDKALMNAFFSTRKMKPQRSFKLQSVRNGKELYSNIYVLRL